MPTKKVFLFVSILVAAVLFAAYLILRPAAFSYCQNELNSKLAQLGAKGKDAIDNFPFKAGETIEYDVKMNFFRIGKASISYQGITAERNTKAINISFLADVVNFRDLEKIYSDLETFNPLWVNRNIDFFNRKEIINEDYASKANSVTITKYKNEKVVSVKDLASDAPYQHVISSIYYCRKLKNLGLGTKFSLNLPLSKLVLEVKRMVDINVPYGKFKAFYIESVPNKYRIWLSADEKRLPLKVEGAISFSPASLIMTKYKEGL